MSAEIIARLQLALANTYVIEREVGRGGMATVYLGRDIRHDRPVAIKVLHPELAASMGSERFLREIRLAATLQHPHILGLYDSGDLGGLLYYVMPFVDGESLRERLDREKQLPIDDALQIARESASALAYAHSKGIVHRDIKPENVMLADGHAIVMDFGIAHAAQDAGAEKLTQTGMSVGTPLYMSPEQAAGERDLDGRSDIYSLGCVLYEMLIGEPPFRGPTALAILARHSMEAVPSLQIVRNTVPDEVEDAVMTALAKAPADRYANAGQFEKALLMSSTTVSHRATSRTMRAQTQHMARVKQRRLGVIAAGLGFAVLTFGSVAWQLHRRTLATPGVNSDADHLAVLPFADASLDHSLGALADGLTEALTAKLSSVDRLTVSTPSNVRAFYNDTIPPDSVATLLKVGTLVTGRIEPQGTDKLRVTLSLMDASGAKLANGSRSIATSRKDLLVLRDSVAREAAILVRQAVGGEVRLREDSYGASSAEAWTALQRARQNRRRAQTLPRSDTAAVSQAYALADSLARQAQTLDPEWVEPLTLRGWIAYERSRRYGTTNPQLAAPWIAQGLPLADSAVAIRETADDLELRGNLEYWKHLLNLGATEDEQNRLLASAEKDFERSRTLNPHQAGALASLSHLYARENRLTDALLTAREAMKADAYVANADLILYRIFTTAWDVGQFAEAKRACDDGTTRFAGDYRFITCQIMLMASGNAGNPDVSRAWTLVDKLDSTIPRPLAPVWTRAVRIWTAGVIAQDAKAKSALRGALGDSARHVLARAHSDAIIDPRRDLLLKEAVVDVILGDRDLAVDRLKEWHAANAGSTLLVGTSASGPGEVSWMFRDVQQDPRLRPLFTQGIK